MPTATDREQRAASTPPRTKLTAMAAGLVAGAALGAAAAALRERGQLKRSASSDRRETALSGASAISASRRYAEVEGIRMSWLEEGEGQPVILLHGIPTSPELWRYVIPRLKGVRVLAWEMVGYGQSIEEGRDRDLSIARQADYLAAWMRQLGIGKAIVGGHDLGGGVAQILTVRHPDLCKALFLTNSVGYDNWPIPSVMALRASGALMRWLPDPLLKLLLMNLFYRGHDDGDAAWAAFHVHADHYLGSGGAAALIRQIKWLDARDTLAVAGRLPSLSIPARIVWGEADRFLKIEYGERFARDLRAPLRRIEGGKHFTPEDHPGLVAEGIMKLAQAAETEQQAPAAH